MPICGTVSQISPPIRIVLVAVIGLIAAWMLFLRPKTEATPAPTPAPADRPRRDRPRARPSTRPRTPSATSDEAQREGADRPRATTPRRPPSRHPSRDSREVRLATAASCRSSRSPPSDRRACRAGREGARQAARSSCSASSTPAEALAARPRRRAVRRGSPRRRPLRRQGRRSRRDTLDKRLALRRDRPRRRRRADRRRSWSSTATAKADDARRLRRHARDRPGRSWTRCRNSTGVLHHGPVPAAAQPRLRATSTCASTASTLPAHARRDQARPSRRFDAPDQHFIDRLRRRSRRRPSTGALKPPRSTRPGKGEDVAARACAAGNLGQASDAADSALRRAPAPRAATSKFANARRRPACVSTAAAQLDRRLDSAAWTASASPST